MQNKDVLIMTSPTPPDRFRGIARFANEHGWYVSLEDRAHPPADWHGDGVLVSLTRQHVALRHAVAVFRRRRIPVVDLTFACPEVRLPRVSADNLAMGRMAARHFAEHGFRHAVWFSSNWGHVQKLRFDGFAGGDFAERVPRLVELSRAELARALQAAPKPVAVFAYSDYDATRVMNACRDAALAVPDEVAILGVDDNLLLCENQSVPLSSIQNDLERVGYTGAELLQRLMNGAHPPEKPILVPPKGISVRFSTDVTATANPLVRHALTVIRSDLRHSFGVEQLAEKLSVPPVQLARAFRAEMGCTVHACILRQRLARAKVLLRSTDLTLEAIAQEAGFCHAAHLANAFRATFGQTPRQWRTATPREDAAPSAKKRHI